MVRRLLGRDLDWLQLEPGQAGTEDVQRPPEVGVQEQGCAERQPVDVELGRLRRVRRRARERRLSQQHRAGHRLLQAAEEGGQLHPGGRHAADGRLRSDADRHRLGLSEPRLPQGVPGGELADRGPVRRRLWVILLPGSQRLRAAPQRGSVVDGVPVLRPGTAAVAEGILASGPVPGPRQAQEDPGDRKSTRLNSSHITISYAVFCLKKKKKHKNKLTTTKKKKKTK